MERYIESNQKKSRVPARLDFLQSATGLILGLFVWVHIVLDASIILGPRAFNWVSENMELAFLSDTGHGYPIAVFFAVFIVFTLFILHALLGMRKFPSSWKQYRIMKDQMAMMTHQDTNLWYVQVLTGFIMFFAGSVHLYTMLSHPGSIDPYLCAGRVVYDHMWFVYLILLACVTLHGNIGLYRLCMKWGWFQGADYQRGRENRAKLKKLMNKLIIVFLSLGLLALLVFVIIGLRNKEDEPCQPTYAPQTHEVEPPVVEDAPEEAAKAFTAHEETMPEAEITHEETVHEETAPEVEPAHEEAEPAPLIEKPLTHDSAPAVREPEPVPEEAEGDHSLVHEEAESYEEAVQESEPAQGDASDDQGLGQEETENHDEAVQEETHEEVHEEAGALESEEHSTEGQTLHIEGGHGPEESL